MDRSWVFVPARSPSVGDRVWWQRRHFYDGQEITYWWSGLVEIRRGNMLVVRDRYGHESIVAKGVSFVREKPT